MSEQAKRGLPEVPPPRRIATASGDGRNVDPGLGSLAGEAAQMDVQRGDRRDLSAVLAGNERREVPTAYPSAAAGTTYYDLPALKSPVWIWSVPAYFYVGGVAGSAMILGAAATALDPKAHRELIRHCRWIAATGAVLSGGLLIHDLGRPSRFLNMLRVFRPTSPMSVGSWVLASAGAASGTAALLGHRRGALGTVGRFAAYAAGLLGVPLIGYAGVLLASTAVPVWRGGRRSLPVLFTSSAAASLASFLELMPLSAADAGVVRRFGIVARGAEIAVAAALEREVGRSSTAARPLSSGVSGALWKAAKALTVASLVASLVPPRRRAGGWARTAAGVMGTAGGLALRFAIFHAGKSSARDPRATFEQERESASSRTTSTSSHSRAPSR